MRIVAVALAVLSVVALFPQGAAVDDCVAPSANNLTTAFCVSRPVDKPAGQVPDLPYWDTYYAYVGVGACVAGAGGNACRGTPNPDAGVPLPSQAGGGDVGAGVFGILWQETNGVDGLQRASTFFGGPRPPDRMVLV